MRPTSANTFFAVMIGYLVNAVLPRFGEVAKCTVLARYEKVPADKMVGTIVAERAFDLVNLVIIIILGIILQASVISSHLSQFFGKLHGGDDGGHTGTYVLVGLALVIILFLIFYQKIKRTKVGKAIQGIGDGVRSIMHLQHRRLFILYTFLIWICYLTMIYLGFLAIPATENLPVLASLVVLGFGAIGMILTPGGFGAYPLIVADILILYGIDKNAALAFGWVSWSAQTGVILVLGFISLILLPIYNRTQHDAHADPAHEEVPQAGGAIQDAETIE
jgi:uncharacterized membrane protein YbhN (UPF0104 family)